MICLGIESTAHTIGVGICELQGNAGAAGKRGAAYGKANRASRHGISETASNAMSGHGRASEQGIKVLANCLRVYRPPAGQGIIPRAAADHHSECLHSVLCEALEKSQVSLNEVGLYSFSRGPGIGQCLRVSCSAAKFLASKRNKPILGINHCMAHLEICRGLLCMKDPLYVYVSGANTQIITENTERENSRGQRYSVLGETLDMGLGNLFDVFAREAGIFPSHGSQVARLAQKGSYFPLPYTVKGMNFAFAGLLTSSAKAVKEGKSQEDASHSLMETAFAEICEASERALCLTGKKEVTVCGGVAQNARFCEMLSMVCKEHSARFGTVLPEYNADNGAMIAYAALSEWQNGEREKMGSLKPDGYWRIDEVE